MFILRNVELKDLADLYDLSSKVQFINLPHDKEIIKKKILQSQECFISPHKDLSRNYYFFVLEDLSKSKVIGASMIHAQHGTENEPHFFLKVDSEHKFSNTINTGFAHGTLKLGLDSNGPTEIGGLVLHPDYRGNLLKLGKQISFVRFLYIAMNLEWFKDTLHSELMPPLDKNGNSPLWEAIGRRFMNMDYQQADVLSRNNKEFILSLFPSDNIYMTLLTPEARHAIGQVGPDTLPVKNMLEKIGFSYINEVDPFDGGPHYQAKTKDVTLISDFTVAQLTDSIKPKYTITQQSLISFEHNECPFFSIYQEVEIDKKNNLIVLDESLIEKFDLSIGDKISVVPF